MKLNFFWKSQQYSSRMKTAQKNITDIKKSYPAPGRKNRNMIPVERSWRTDSERWTSHHFVEKPLLILLIDGLLWTQVM